MRWLVTLSVFLVLAAPLGAQFFDPSVYAARRGALFEKIGEGLAVVPGYSGQGGDRVFRQSNHLVYLAGIEAPNAYLVLDGKARQTLLFLPDRFQFASGQFPTADFGDLRRAFWNRPPARLAPGPEAEKTTGISSIHAIDLFWQKIEPLGRRATKILVAFEDEAIWAPPPLGPLRSPGRQIADRLRDLLPGTEVENLEPVLREMRLVKDTAEITSLRRAAEITCLGINEVMTQVKPGMTEREVSGLLHYVFKKNGAQRTAFDSIVQSGPNSMLYYSLGWENYDAYSRRMRDGDLLFLDIGAEYNFYAADVCRTLPVSGRFDPAQRKYYDIVLEASEAALARIRPGVMMLEVVRAAAEVFQKHGLDRYEDIASLGVDRIWGPMPSPTHFLNRGRGLEPGVRDLGHHIGLDALDGRDYRLPLQPGMVFTVEPKIFVTEQGYGIMIEDQVLVTDAGAENLSRHSPRTASEIEAAMSKKGPGKKASPR